MIDEAQARLVHIRSHVAELDAAEAASAVAEAPRSRGRA